MILPCIPFRTDKNLFLAYDEAFSRMLPDDYLAIMDHDVMFTSNDWMKTIEDGIAEVEDGKFFTGYCNRVACRWQVPEDCPSGNEYNEHRNFLVKSHLLELAPHQRPGTKRLVAIDRTGRALLSGFFMVIRKDHWELMKPHITVREGCLGLDNELHEVTKMLNVKIWQLPIYLYHWYRGGTNDKSHLL